VRIVHAQRPRATGVPVFPPAHLQGGNSPPGGRISSSQASKHLSRIGHTHISSGTLQAVPFRPVFGVMGQLEGFQKSSSMRHTAIVRICGMQYIDTVLIPSSLDPAVWDTPGAPDIRRVGGAMRLFQSPICSLIYRRGLKCVQQSLLWAWSCVQFRPVWLCLWHHCQRCGLRFGSMAAIINMLTT
jgi:hypothetical protein